MYGAENNTFIARIRARPSISLPRIGYAAASTAIRGRRIVAPGTHTNWFSAAR